MLHHTIAPSTRMSCSLELGLAFAGQRDQPPSRRILAERSEARRRPWTGDQGVRGHHDTPLSTRIHPSHVRAAHLAMTARWLAGSTPLTAILSVTQAEQAGSWREE